MCLHFSNDYPEESSKELRPVSLKYVEDSKESEETLEPEGNSESQKDLDNADIYKPGDLTKFPNEPGVPQISNPMPKELRKGEMDIVSCFDEASVNYKAYPALKDTGVSLKSKSNATVPDKHELEMGEVVSMAQRVANMIKTQVVAFMAHFPKISPTSMKNTMSQEFKGMD